ncbi:polar amino acid transport system substrate-binding protein [Inhella inkyongensis]|uniref:Polar amino acid transport system substrate-binding protein n=1 Tax=Inhella inkyongensis TaxID=392593 RepID=A0A840S3Y4_9BURK|nr:transporter substrate-binding domain-containing protein [Inhella inkyongensis]MBB5203229.1 polar amino acid transport system substrate-binding protein [Inhella inkyongensis]
MKMTAPRIAALLALTAAQGSALANVNLCMENADNVPWILMGAGKAGYVQIMMAEVEKTVGFSVKVTPMSWKECLAGVKAGTIDGAVSGSHNKERAEFADYPSKLDGEVDATRRMYRAAYYIYKAKGAKVAWDGKVLTAPGLIGAQAGFSVVGQLKEAGAKVEDNTPTADEVLKRVAAGKYVAGVVQVNEGDTTLADNPAIREAVEKVNPAFVEKAYYTFFSKAYTAKNSANARAVWNAIVKVRNDPAFKAQVASLTKGSE